MNYKLLHLNLVLLIFTPSLCIKKPKKAAQAAPAAPATELAEAAAVVAAKSAPATSFLTAKQRITAQKERKDSIEAENARLKEKIENAKPEIDRDTLRSKHQELEAAWQRHQVERGTKNNMLWMKYAAKILQCDPTHASIANALTQHHPSLFNSEKQVEPSEALQVFEQLLTGPLAGMFSPTKEGERTEYHKELQTTRDATRGTILPEIEQRRLSLLNTITYERNRHGMAAGTWGDTLATLNPFGTK